MTFLHEAITFPATAKTLSNTVTIPTQARYLFKLWFENFLTLNFALAFDFEKRKQPEKRFNLHRCVSPHWLDGVPGESGETKVKETPRALWVKNLVAGRCARNVKSCLSLRLPALFTRREAGHVYQQKLQRFITVIISNRGIFVTQDASADWLHIRGKCWRITLAYHDYSVWIYAAVHSKLAESSIHLRSTAIFRLTLVFTSPNHHPSASQYQQGTLSTSEIYQDKGLFIDLWLELG